VWASWYWNILIVSETGEWNILIVSLNDSVLVDCCVYDVLYPRMYHEEEVKLLVERSK
jgi:hypothetical protein